MFDLQLYDYLRLLTSVLAFVSLWRSAYRAHLLWGSYTQRLKELHWVMSAFLVLVLEASLENLIKGIDGGPRTLLSFLVTLACMRAMFRNEGYIKFENEVNPVPRSK